MDDGASPAIGIVVFLVLTIVNGLLYGFLTALEETGESQIQKRAEEGNKHASWLLTVKDDPYRVRHAIQIMTAFVSSIFGIYLIRLLGNALVISFLEKGSAVSLRILCYAIAAVLGIFLFAVLGLIAPQKIAARKSEKSL